MTERPGNLADLWPDRATGLLELPAGTELWALHDAGLWVVIPTNLRRKADGTAVMGAGLALAAARRFPDLAARYGVALGAGKGRFVCAEHRLRARRTAVGAGPRGGDDPPGHPPRGAAPTPAHRGGRVSSTTRRPCRTWTTRTITGRAISSRQPVPIGSGK